MTNNLPERLKEDALLETVLEIRIEPDSNMLFEVLLGRLVGKKEWEEFSQTRLPAADIPQALKQIDNDLKYQPTVELVSPDGAISVRVGNYVFVYSRRGNYPGWDRFGEELRDAISHLYSLIPNVTVSRLGLRYINALRSDVHKISGISDIAISVSVDGETLSNSLNLNYVSDAGNNHKIMSRIASADLANGAIPEAGTVIVDIDVFTPTDFSTNDESVVLSWVEEAHSAEKKQFFKVLGDDATQRLRDD